MDDTFSHPRQFAPELVDFGIVLFSLLLLGILIFFWALVFHKRGLRHKNRIYRAPRREHVKQGARTLGEFIRQRRHHRQHQRHRPLNPTLAQTGGLPPIRGEEKPPSPTPPP